LFRALKPKTFLNFTGFFVDFIFESVLTFFAAKAA
jgi:hypothetical protein